MKNVAKKMLLFDVELMSTSKKVFLPNFNSKRLWLAKLWCTQLLAGKLEKLPLSWLALSTFCYLNFAGSLIDIIDMAGWDFYFLTVLLAGSEERVFFPQER